ncbi:C40 family peptidase [Actinomadura rugatobispora]|uniref:C40 family peptidase n=1 Tax=Actinomadura rugatobispora TaxID=1994 RepID=A0ABW0ZXG8_9ACTN
MRYGKSGGGDEGAATSVLVMFMAVVLAAGFLLFGRIGQAGDMRTRAQIGADAAALGALAPLRDQAVSLALDGLDPSAAGYWSVGTTPEAAAASYADKNGTRVLRARLSGREGQTTMVEAATRFCQLKRDGELTAKERDDLRQRRNLCTDNTGKTGIGRAGSARAVATMKAPRCSSDYWDPPPESTGIGPTRRMVCDGVQVYPGGDRERVRKLFKLRLVDGEDPVAYTGQPEGMDLPPGGPVGGGGVVVSECATNGQRPADDLPFGAAVVAWALCWRGTPYSWGGGTVRGPGRGICCSPGGYDGRLTIGFDCSGLTLYAVYHASKGRIAMGHFTGTQLDDPRGRPVPLNQLQAGDLVFFGPRPTDHVAVYYGDGKMVEAPRTGDVVKISPLRSSLTYARRFG